MQLQSKIDFISNTILKDDIDYVDIFKELSIIYNFLSDDITGVIVSKDVDKTILDMKCKNSLDISDTLNNTNINIYGSMFNITTDTTNDSITIVLS